MSDYLRYPQGGNTRTGSSLYPAYKKGSGKKKTYGKSKKKKTNQTFYNILDLIGAQKKQFKPGQVTKPKRNLNMNEHRAHKGQTGAGLSPMPPGTGLEIPTVGSVADFMGQAGSLVNPQYDAAVQAIRELQNQKKTRARTNQGVLGDMYNQLSKYYSTDAQKAAGTIYDTATTSVKNQGKDARDSVAATYTAMQDAQRKEAEQLGIAGLGLDETMQEQNTDKAFVDSLLAKDTAAVQGNLASGKQSLQNFNQSSANVAKLEGSEQQASLIRMLEDYLGETDAQIGTLEGQRAGSLAEIAMQLAQQDFQNKMAQYNAQVGQQDSAWNREMQLMQIQAQMAEAQAAARAGQKEEKLEDPWSKVADYANRVQPGFGKNIMAVINQNMQDEELQELLNNRAQPVTPASFARYFNSQNRRGTGADSAALNQTAQYLYTLLYGRG